MSVLCLGVSRNVCCVSSSGFSSRAVCWIQKCRTLAHSPSHSHSRFPGFPSPLCVARSKNRPGNQSMRIAKCERRLHNESTAVNIHMRQNMSDAFPKPKPTRDYASDLPQRLGVLCEQSTERHVVQFHLLFRPAELRPRR